jgi:hypothetical protein
MPPTFDSWPSCLFLVPQFFLRTPVLKGATGLRRNLAVDLESFMESFCVGGGSVCQDLVLPRKVHGYR